MTISRLTTGGSLLLLAFLAHGASAQSELENLGARDYAQRQNATRQLWSQRATAREDVERAARSPDPEVAARARWILNRWQQGLLPDTPPEVLRQLSGSEGIERLEGLLDAGLFQAVIVAVEQASGAATGPQLRNDVSESIERRFPFYLRTAVELNQLDAFLQLLQVATESPALAVARAELLIHLGFDLQQHGLLPATAQRWPERQRTRTEILVLAVLGDVERALQTARDTNQDDMVRACHILLGNWEELIGESQREAEAATPGSLIATRNWSDLLVAATRGGQETLADQAAAKLAGPASSATGLPGAGQAELLAADLRWRCLLIHGYVEPALKILRNSNPVDAAEVLSYLGRFDEAFEVLDIDPQNLAADLQALFEAARREQNRAADTPNRPAGTPQGLDEETDAMSRLLMGGKLMLRVGNSVRARQLFEQVAMLDEQAPPSNDGRNATNASRARYEAVMALWSMGRTDWAIDLSAAEGQGTIEPNILYRLIRQMARYDDESAKAIASVWEATLKMYPDWPATDRLRLVYQLFQGETPWDQEIDSQFEDLYGHLQGGKPSVRRVNGRLVITGRGYANAALADFFLQLGQADYAKQIYSQLSASGDSNADLRLADLELASGDAREAITIYRRIWDRHSGFRAQRHRVNTADADLTAALKAAVGEMTAIDRMGDEIEANKQRQLIRWMLCCPSGSVRKEFSEHLVEIGQQDLAKETLQRLMRYTAFGGDETLDFGQIAAAYGSLLETDDPLESARWNDLALSGTLESSAYYARGYLILPAKHHALRALAAAEEHDSVAVVKHLQDSLQLYPMNITLAEETLGALRKQGLDEEANAALGQIFEVGLKHLERFPEDAQVSNNLAWVAALAGERLDQAFELSQRACFLEPDSVSYRDTLAEVLYRRGEVEAALQIERLCLLDEPGLWHLHEQIARFEAGD